MAVDPKTLVGSELTAWVQAVDAVRSRMEGVFLTGLGEWDARGEWGLDGDRSGPAWLAKRCDMRRSTALSLCRDARRLRQLPVTESACRNHGSSKVRVMLSFINERTLDEYQRQEAMLLEEAAKLTVDQTIVMMRFWALHADPEGSDPADRTKNELHLNKGLNGRWMLDGNLDAETGAALHKALESRADTLFRAYQNADDGITRAHSQLMAEAMAMLVRDANRGDTEAGIPAQPSITVIVDYDVLINDCATKTGVAPDMFKKRCHINGTDPVRGETARRLACDAGINRMIIKGASIVLDAGRTTRTATDGQRRAMKARSPSCEFGDCDIPDAWCDAHHIQWWGRDRGKTDIDDLAFMCSWHHYLIHEGNWTMSRNEFGTIDIQRPDGTRFNHQSYQAA